MELEAEAVSDQFKRLVDLETKKSVHINLTRAAHSEYKKTLFDYSLSMQEVFETFATMVGEGDPGAMSIVQEAYRLKREKAVRSITKKEAENLYDVISEIEPFK